MRVARIIHKKKKGRRELWKLIILSEREREGEIQPFHLEALR